MAIRYAQDGIYDRDSILVGEIVMKTAPIKRLAFAIVSVHILFVFLSGCRTPSGPKLYVLPEGTITVKGDKIYSGGQLFAELQYFRKSDRPNKSPSHFGFGIYYFTHGDEVWVSPKQGWRVEWRGEKYTKIQDADEVWSRFHKEWREYQRGTIGYPGRSARYYLGDRDKSIEWPPISYDVRISNDGKYIYYKVRRPIIWHSRHKYFVEYGVSKRRFRPF